VEAYRFLQHAWQEEQREQELRSQAT